ncbi:DNA-binding transcriptional regulator, AcrR family [Salinihabitans flavidus]|uniref:DNA-binding transcriptional regulator, AcrR family n=1 Tax=Salinihabitans flavidus TaxID=569882 RepID=A0A1H8PB24_9RHOB|nr:TetR/AcrR family transcriptional regulator [Salinihabitans flavidus]SEO39140.1 DNA-binding transcriptional regulator, AcrR family [Salinihabitans flavidus]
MAVSSKIQRNREFRRATIIASARNYFARAGLSGTTRGLAKEIGCSQAMFYQYFKNSEDLVQAVFDDAFSASVYEKLSRIEATDPDILRREVKAVLVEYCRNVTDEDCIRLMFHASLSGYTEPYQIQKAAVREKILEPICHLMRLEAGYGELKDVPISDVELEMAWRPFGGVIFNMIRLHVFKVPLKLPLDDIISNTVDQHLEGWYQCWPAPVEPS